MFRRLLFLVLLALVVMPWQAIYAQDDPASANRPVYMPIYLQNAAAPSADNIVQDFLAYTTAEVRTAETGQCNPACLSVMLIDRCNSGATPQQYSNQHYSAEVITNYSRIRFIPYSGYYYPNQQLYRFDEFTNPPAYTCSRWKANEGPWAGQWAGMWCGQLNSGQYLVLQMSRLDMTC